MRVSARKTTKNPRDFQGNRGDIYYFAVFLFGNELLAVSYVHMTFSAFMLRTTIHRNLSFLLFYQVQCLYKLV